MNLVFHWDDNNRIHIAKHGITPEEAEQIVNDEPIDITVHLRNGEERTVQIGQDRCKSRAACRHNLAR